MSRLIFFRHAMPAIDEARPSKDWPISPEGRIAAGRMAEKLAPFVPAFVIASPEPKAADTGRVVAQRLGAPIAFDADLAEHHRETVGWLPRAQVEAAIEGLLRQPDRLIYGEETGDEAHARFAGAVERHSLAHPDQALIVATHGTVISLWLSRRLGVDPMPLWRSLSLPSAVVMAPDGRSYEIITADA
jgi:2,3-bisphosphoglycerate-dependent phosphoglycerate mutase